MTSAWDWTKGAVGTAGQYLGQALGTAKYEFRGRDVNKNSFINPNQDEDRNRLTTALDNVDNRTAPLVGNAPDMGQAAQSQGANGIYTAQAANIGPVAQANQTNIDTSQSDQARGGEMDLARQLQETAAGRGPSLGTQMIKSGTDQALAGEIAAARAGRGNPALATRTAADNSVKMIQDAETAAAQQKMTEAQNAQNQLGGVLNNVRTGDIGVAENQAGLAQDVKLANTKALQDAAHSNADYQQAATLANQGNYQAAAQLLQNNEQFNASAKNALTQAQATLQLQAAQGDQQAQLQLDQLNDTMKQYYTTGINGLDQQQVANLMAYEQMQTDNVNTQQSIKEKGFDDQQAREADLRKDMMKAAGVV